MGKVFLEDFTDIENPMREVDVLLSSCAWALRSTASVVTGKTPGQMAFNQDMIMHAAIEMNWEDILRKKQKMICKNNELENKKRSGHIFKVGDYVKIIHEKNTHFRPSKLSVPSEGPYRIVEILPKGTVKIQRAGYREIVSITRIAPFFVKNAELIEE